MLYFTTSTIWHSVTQLMPGPWSDVYLETLHEAIHCFMDMVDGSTPHRVFLEGRYQNDRGEYVYLPEENEGKPTAIFSCALQIAMQLLHLSVLDGVRIGTQLKHYTSMSNCFYGVVLIWNRASRMDYKLWEVNPRYTTKLSRLTYFGWDSTSSVMFYIYNRSIEELTRPREIPAFSDLDLFSIPVDVSEFPEVPEFPDPSSMPCDPQTPSAQEHHDEDDDHKKPPKPPQGTRPDRSRSRIKEKADVSSKDAIDVTVPSAGDDDDDLDNDGNANRSRSIRRQERPVQAKVPRNVSISEDEQSVVVRDDRPRSREQRGRTKPDNVPKLPADSTRSLEIDSIGDAEFDSANSTVPEVDRSRSPHGKQPIPVSDSVVKPISPIKQSDDNNLPSSPHNPTARSSSEP